MKNEIVPVFESMLMLVYIVASLSSFIYFFHRLLVNLAAAGALSSEIGVAL
jgi:hypothetical protein